jgi:hypothetical protein
MKTILLLFVSVVCSAGRSFSAAPAPKPNILLVFMDNVGYGDLGCYGNAAVKTPHMDRLAADGVRCTDFTALLGNCFRARRTGNGQNGDGRRGVRGYVTFEYFHPYPHYPEALIWQTSDSLDRILGRKA